MGCKPSGGQNPQQSLRQLEDQAPCRRLQGYHSLREGRRGANCLARRGQEPPNGRRGPERQDGSHPSPRRGSADEINCVSWVQKQLDGRGPRRLWSAAGGAEPAQAVEQRPGQAAPVRERPGATPPPRRAPPEAFCLAAVRRSVWRRACAARKTSSSAWETILRRTITRTAPTPSASRSICTTPISWVSPPRAAGPTGTPEERSSTSSRTPQAPTGSRR